MELNHLKYFYNVVKFKSFSAASRELQVSQSAVSKLLKQFEANEGLKLLDRDRRGKIELTPVGRIYFERCKNIFQEIENLKSELGTFNEGELRGDLRIGASDHLCNYAFPALLQTFSDKHPRVMIDLFMGPSREIKEGLLKGDIELSLFHAGIPDSRFAADKLCEVEFSVIGKSKKGKALALKDLSAMPFILPRTKDYSGPPPLFKKLAQMGVKPTEKIIANSQETQKRMAVSGLGWAVVPTYSVKLEVSAGQVETVKLPKKLALPLYLVKLRNRTASNAARHFEVMLRENLPDLLL
jgi:DNA-binding transcriptional LysR family regulator